MNTAVGKNVARKKKLRPQIVLASSNHRFDRFRGRRQPRARYHRAATSRRGCLRFYCRCPSARSSTRFVYSSNFSPFERQRKPLGREDTLQIKHVRCWQITRRPSGLQIPSRPLPRPAYHSQSRLLKDRFKRQNCSLCGRPPVLDM